MGFRYPSQTCVPTSHSLSTASVQCLKTLRMKKEGPLKLERWPTCCLTRRSHAPQLAEKRLSPSNYHEHHFCLHQSSSNSQFAGVSPARQYFLLVRCLWPLKMRCFPIEWDAFPSLSQANVFRSRGHGFNGSLSE